MNEYQNNKHDIEDQLANFTDLILNEKPVKKEETRSPQTRSCVPSKKPLYA